MTIKYWSVQLNSSVALERDVVALWPAGRLVNVRVCPLYLPLIALQLRGIIDWNRGNAVVPQPSAGSDETEYFPMLKCWTWYYYHGKVAIQEWKQVFYKIKRLSSHIQKICATLCWGHSMYTFVETQNSHSLFQWWYLHCYYWRLSHPYARSPLSRICHFTGQLRPKTQKSRFFALRVGTRAKIDQKSPKKSITAVAARHRPVSRL